MKSVVALVCAALCAAAGSSPSIGGRQTVVAPSADRVLKAAFLIRFADFVTWPADLPGRKFTVCLSATHDFGTAVEDATKGSSVRGKSVVVRHLKPTDQVTDCQVLYIAPADHHLLPLTRRRPILTVGEDVGFCQRGGVIKLRVVDQRMRFEVSLEHARVAGLTVDPQLLRLAVAVYGGGQ
jgi:hypothetical protein